MSTIVQSYDASNNAVYPVTHLRAVRDSSGTTLESMMQDVREMTVGYYECSTPGSTAAKTITTDSSVFLSTKILCKVKFVEKNTVNNATMDINGTGAKPLYYNGVRVSTNNSWYAGEIMTLFYDGAAFQLNSLPDLDEYDVSARNGGHAFTFEEAVALVPEAYRHGGLKLRFISNSDSGQSSDNRYVQYRLMNNQWSTTETDWQGVDDEPTAGSNNLVKSGGVAEKLSELESEAGRIAGAKFDTSSTGKNLNVALTKTGGVEGADYVNTDVSYHPLSDKIKISYKLRTLNESHPVICFYDSNKNIISYIEGGNIVQGEIYAPSSSSFFRYCTTEESYCYLNVQGEIDNIINNIFNIKSEDTIEEYTATQGVYVPANAINEDLQPYDSASISSIVFLESGATIKTTNHYVNSAISAIAKKNTDGTYTSLVENNNTSTYQFTANEDCYIIISYLQELGTPVISRNRNIISDILDEINRDRDRDNKILIGKKVGFIGDSICYGHSYLGGYGKIIAERNNMQYQNLAQNGATITDNTDGRFHICQHINDIDADCDYVILEGGVNDSTLLGYGEISNLGTITYGSDAELDLNTFAGALEYTLKQVIIRFHGKKIGYIIPHLITHGMEWYQPPVIKPSERDNVYYTIINACRKWGVPVCDLTGVVPCFEDMASSQSMAFMAQLYCPDGWHPNEAGYKKYYCDKIESWMKTL